MLTELLPVLLPIALFIITLIIIFTLRSSDNRSRGLATVKKLLDNYRGDIEASDNNFKQYAVELEQTVSRKDQEVKNLIQTVNSQLGELKSYSEDLVRLKNTMETYRTALEGLALLTKDADLKVQTVQDEVDRLDKVRAVIDGFKQDMKDADEHLRRHEQQVIQLERESIDHMNQAVSETDSNMDEAIENLHKESAEVFTDFKERTATETDFRLRKLDDAFQAVIHTVQQFFGELETKIDEARNIAERLEAKAKTFVSTAPSEPIAETPKMVEADMGQNSEGFAKTDFRDEISVLSQVAPEAEKPKTDNLPKFKAPKFTPKTDEEYEQEDFAEDLAPEEENTYGDGISETDDFASFGGVDDELPIGSGDLRNMDIMDMDLKKWETYGKEEVIPFDDQT
jgi:myosin heavy subunit